MTKFELRIIIGENIRKERLARDISIDELSEMIDLSPGFVGLIERGVRGTTPKTLYMLSEVFDIPIDSLFRKALAPSLSFDEESLNVLTIKGKKITSLITGLSQTHLDFIIGVIKGLRTVYHNPIEESREEDDDE